MDWMKYQNIENRITRKLLRNPKNNHVLTEKALIDMGLRVIFSDTFGTFSVVIYEDGSTVYTDLVTERATVLDLRKAKTYICCDRTVCDMSDEEIAIPLFLYGDSRINRNADSRSDSNDVNFDKFENTKACSNSDEYFSEEEERERREAQRKLNAALDKLTERQREVYELCYDKKMTEEKAAEVLGISRSSVQKIKTQIFKKVKKLMKAK